MFSTSHNLDARAAEEVLSRTFIDSVALRKTVVKQNTKDKAGKPDNHRQERECLCRLPLAAVVRATERDAAPAPCTAAVDALEISHVDTKDSGPGSGKEEIRGVAGHAGLGRNHPDDGEDDGQGRDDDTVDDATERPDIVAVALVEEVGAEAEDNSSEDKLCSAQDERGKTGHQHLELVRVVFLVVEEVKYVVV